MSAVINGTDGITFPTWTTGTRPATPVAGQAGFNTTIGATETYTGSAWLTSDLPATGASGNFLQSNGTAWTSVSTLGVANGGTGSTTSTGTGAVVLATSPTLSTPDLGTPSALVGTNITGTAASFTAGTATRASGINATGASYLTGNAIGSYICTNFNVTPNGLGYTGTWTQYNATSSSGQPTLYGWIRTA